MAERKRDISRVLAAAFILLFLTFASSLSHAELEAVSGFDDDNTALVPIVSAADAVDVAYSLANGFPIWYEDTLGLKLELCLDRNVEIEPGVFIDPCLLENNPVFPPSFPGNFGNEAFWWNATTFGTYQSSQGGVLVAGGDALLVTALEAAFASDLGVLDGDQVAFGRIRLRISVPVTGTYRVTHPFGTRDYVITDPGRRAINQTQDIGNFLLPGPPPAGDFTVALFDGLAPVEPVPFDPSINAGIVNENGRTIGPFLRPDADPIVALDGRQYIADPGTELNPILQPVINGPFGNVLSIELLDTPETPIPEGFFLNGTEQTQVVEFTEFQVMGKIFNEGPNIRPVAIPDAIGTPVNTAVRIDVAANDLDPVGEDNVHGLNLQALGLPVDQSDTADLRTGILLTRPLTTAQGGTVRRFTTISTAQTVFIYTPPTDFVGQDTFYYVIQDTGGLISEPALVTVNVENLVVNEARYRTRLGKWTISGTSSETSDNFVTLSLGPRAALSGEAEVPPVESAAQGEVTLRLGAETLQFQLTVNPLPSTAVTQAHIHVGGLDENGPIIFFLYDGVLEDPFTGTKTGTLTNLNLIPRPAQGVSTFADAMTAILDNRAYVNVYTLANPEGEIRGQLGVTLLSEAEVGPDGRWSFQGKSPVSPGGGVRSVNVESAKGVRVLGVPLVVK
jgi:hypothetical protein